MHQTIVLKYMIFNDILQKEEILKKIGKEIFFGGKMVFDKILPIKTDEFW